MAGTVAGFAPRVAATTARAPPRLTRPAAGAEGGAAGAALFAAPLAAAVFPDAAADVADCACAGGAAVCGCTATGADKLAPSVGGELLFVDCCCCVTPLMDCCCGAGGVGGGLDGALDASVAAGGLDDAALSRKSANDAVS